MRSELKKKKKNLRKKKKFIHVSFFFFFNTQGIGIQSVIKGQYYYQIIHCRVFFLSKIKKRAYMVVN